MTPPDRYSPGTCLTIWAGLAALSWIGAAYFIAVAGWVWFAVAVYSLIGA